MSVMGDTAEGSKQSASWQKQGRSEQRRSNCGTTSGPLSHNIRTPESWLGGSRSHTGGTVSPVGAGFLQTGVNPSDSDYLDGVASALSPTNRIQTELTPAICNSCNKKRCSDSRTLDGRFVKMSNSVAEFRLETQWARLQKPVLCNFHIKCAQVSFRQ